MDEDELEELAQRVKRVQNTKFSTVNPHWDPVVDNLGDDSDQESLYYTGLRNGHSRVGWSPRLITRRLGVGNEAAVVDAKSTNWDNGMCPTKEFAEKNRGTPKDPESEGTRASTEWRESGKHPTRRQE